MKRLHIALVYNTASLGLPDAAEDRAGMADLLHMIRNIARNLRRLGHRVSLLPLAHDGVHLAARVVRGPAQQRPGG